MKLTPEIIWWLGPTALLAVGFYGLMAGRNLFQIIIAVQILGKAAVFALVVAGLSSGLLNLGQSLAVTVIVADTIVAVIGLALAIQVKRHTGSLDVKALSSLRG
jgi:NADH:ubiquinone oxidoreductase subunit K